MYEIFKQDWNLKDLSKFVEIQPRQDLLMYFIHCWFLLIYFSARKDWLEQNKQESWSSSENLDVEYGLQPHPALDIMFFEIPDVYSSLPSFQYTDAVTEGSIFGQLAYHNIYEETEEDLYGETIDSKMIPAASDLLNQGKSVSLGVVVKYGSIATVKSTNAEQSSGSVHFDNNLNVFGIGIGSYYDVPPVSVEEEKLNGASTIAQLINFDLDVNEKGDSTLIVSRNRNLVLTFSHSGVKALLQKL